MRQVVVALQLRLLAPSAVQSVKALEGRFCPDAEAANMTSGGQLHQIKLVDRNEVDARDVAEGLGQTLILPVNDQWAQFTGAATVAHLALSGTETPRLVNLNTSKDL